MPSIDLGRITPIPKGTWVSSTTYERLDIVNNNGSSYIAKQDVPINISITTNTYWDLLAQKGNSGNESIDDTIGQGATTTVWSADKSWREINTLKINTIPAIEDFGEVSATTLQDIINNTNVTILKCSGQISTDTPIIINRAITLICSNFEVIQTKWGYPGIIIDANNINILGEITVICDVETRSAITDANQVYHTNSGDPKSDSTGIMLGYGTTLRNFNAERINVKNFIGGVTCLAVSFTNININYIYVENVDFGLFGAHFYNTYIKNIEFKNIASYIGSIDPSHAIYLTGGTSFGLSKSVTIENISGNGCKSKSTDTVISIKSCIDFHCNGGNVSNIAGLASVLTSTGVIKDIYIEDSTTGISAQLDKTNFLFERLFFQKIDVNGEYINWFTTDSIVTVSDCTFNINSDDSNYVYVYVSGKKYTEKNCIYISPANSTAILYNRTGASTGFYVYEPEASILLFTGNIDSTKAYVLLNPQKLNFPKTNCLVPNPHFVPNTYIATEAEYQNYPTAFKTNDKVLIIGGSVQNINNNNETNGNVYTLFNDGTSSIINNARIITKTGQNYGPSDWTIFRFINIGNIAYEI